jgi:uncharacterized protein (TIGR02145 family)
MSRCNVVWRTLLLTAVMVAALAAPAAAAKGSFTDNRDGKTYETVKIGKQTWLAENLNYKTPSGSWCYDNDESNCKKYGRLYDWNTAMGACPAGWKLPDTTAWDVLKTSAGGRETAGRKLKSRSGWKENGGGTDDYGFSALPGGHRYSDGGFYDAGSIGYWWTSTEYDVSDAYLRYMNYGNDGLYENYYYLDRNEGYSVRCVKQ